MANSSTNVNHRVSLNMDRKQLIKKTWEKKIKRFSFKHSHNITNELARECHSSFSKFFQDADERILVESFDGDPFLAYLDEIDTTIASLCPATVKRVYKASRMAKVGPGDVVVDLKSGDERFLTAAAAKFKATRAAGIESDHDLVKTLKRLANQAIPNDNNTTTFILGDLPDLPKLVCDTNWTVMIAFLLPDHTDKFADLLLHHHRKGARIVSLVFNLDEIPELNLVASDATDGIFVYSSNYL